MTTPKHTNSTPSNTTAITPQNVVKNDSTPAPVSEPGYYPRTLNLSRSPDPSRPGVQAAETLIADPVSGGRDE